MWQTQGVDSLPLRMIGVSTFPSFLDRPLRLMHWLSQVNRPNALCLKVFSRERVEHVRIASLLHEERTSILFESPNRTAETLGDLAAALGDWRSATVVRELTKVHETITRAPLGDLARRFADTEVKGEVVLVIGPGTPAELDTDAVDEALLAGLERGERMKDVARSVATAFQVDQRATYDRALGLRESSPGS